MNFTQWIQKGKMPNVVHKHMIMRAEVNEPLITPTEEEQKKYWKYESSL